MLKKICITTLIIASSLTTLGVAEDYCPMLMKGDRVWLSSGSKISATKYLITCNYYNEDLLQAITQPIAGTENEATVGIKLRKHGIACPAATGSFHVLCNNNQIVYDAVDKSDKTVGKMTLELSRSGNKYRVKGTGEYGGAALAIDIYSDMAQQEKSWVSEYSY